MTLSETISLLFLVLAALGWARAFDRVSRPRPEHVSEAWQHRRYVRNEIAELRANYRRMS